MNVYPDKLIRHFGTSIGKILATVNGKPSPGIDPRRWECPLHPDGEACLSATRGPSVVFSCSNPACRFRGDAASLASMALKISVADAVRMFMEGGELSDCLPEPMSEEDAELYLDTAKSQTMLKAWLAVARARLRECPEKAGIRPGLSRLNVKLLHPDVGLFSADGSEVPRCLRELEKPKYAKSCLILYPYTMNGEVTRIEVLDTTDKSFRYTAVVTHPTAGVFGEELAESGQKLLAVERPEAAARLYALWALSSAKTPPIVAFSGYPLPEAFRNATNIDVVSSSDFPVSTEFVLRTLAAPEIKAGGVPLMRVLDWKCPVGSIPREDLENPFGARLVTNDLQHMAAKRFAAMVAGGDPRPVLDMLASERVPAAMRELIRSAANAQLTVRGGFNGDLESTKRLVAVLDSAECGEPSNVALANGRTLHCGPDGVFAVRANGVMDPIANVGLSVDSRVVADGGEAFDCTVSARGGFPAVKVRLEWRDLTAERMRAAVQRAYSDLGLSPYVAFYSSTGFAWRDIVSKLAENCHVERGAGKPVKLGKPVSGCSIRVKPVK